MLIGPVSLGIVTQQRLYLSQQEPLAGSLLAAALMLDDLLQVGHGSGILLTSYIVVGHRVVPVLASPVVDAVALLLDDDVLGIVEPVELHIALGLPSTGNALNGGLCLVETRHIGERGGSLLELSLLKLRLTQQQPRMPEEGIVLAAVQPLDVFGGLAAALLPFRTLLDAVEFDDLLRLLDGSVEMTLSQSAAVLVGNRIKGNQLGTVVLVAVLLLQTALYECL